jgi:hypothetical protein
LKEDGRKIRRDKRDERGRKKKQGGMRQGRKERGDIHR